MTDIYMYMGVIGATIILLLFVLNELGRIKNTNFWYDLGNFVGAVLLLVYAWSLGSTPFMILNAVWAFVALRDVMLKRG